MLATASFACKSPTLDFGMCSGGYPTLEIDMCSGVCFACESPTWANCILVLTSYNTQQTNRGVFASDSESIARLILRYLGRCLPCFFQASDQMQKAEGTTMQKMASFACESPTLDFGMCRGRCFACESPNWAHRILMLSECVVAAAQFYLRHVSWCLLCLRIANVGPSQSCVD